MDYVVGQVLYCLNEKNFKIIPVQVVEEVIRTRIDGMSKTYMIKFPDKKESIVDIADLKTKIFTSKETIRAYMIENTHKSIDRMLNEADTLQQSVFSVSSEEHAANEPTNFQTIPSFDNDENIVQPVVENDIIKIDLGNGLKANMKKNELDKVKN